MSAFKRNNTDDFYTHILQVTHDARKNAVSNRTDALTKVNNILKNRIEHLLQNLVKHVIKEINIIAHANASTGNVYEFNSNNTMIKITSTSQKNYDNLVSNLTLADITTTNSPKMFSIRYNGFEFSQNDIINMPTINSIIKYLQKNPEISKFKFTKGMTLGHNATNVPVIVASWGI